MQMYLGWVGVVIVVLIDIYQNVDERRAETKEARKDVNGDRSHPSHPTSRR